MYMSILTGRCDFPSDAVQAAMTWTALPKMGVSHPAGQVREDVTSDSTLIFALSKQPLDGAGIIATHPVTAPAGAAFLRLDEVCFPVGAIAYRHTHTGAGFRYLVRGSLQIETDTHTQVMSEADHWYEPCDTPVRATALQHGGVTSFVRCMIVPAEYEGKSTFQLVDPCDGDLPRLQMTHRHIDYPIYVDAG